MKYIIFDTETNGFSPENSLLSISAMKIQIDGSKIEIIDEYNRYYHSIERENNHALKVNKLYKKNIEQIRNETEADYPIYFKDDAHSFLDFSKDVNGFIAHNMNFDEKFIPFELWSTFCTLEHFRGKEDYKSNKLSDVTEEIGIAVEEAKLHDSKYDTELLYEIVKYLHYQSTPELIDYFNESKDILPSKDLFKSILDIEEEVSFIFNKKNYSFKFSKKLFTRPELLKIFEDIGITLVDKLVKTHLKSYRRKDLLYPKESLGSIIKSVEEVYLKKTIGLSEEEKSSVVFEEGNVNMSSIVKSFNKVLHPSQKLTAAKFNNYLCDREILSKEDNKTVVNENSIKYGIEAFTKVKMNGEEYKAIEYTDKGKEFILQNLEWILGGEKI